MKAFFLSLFAAISLASGAQERPEGLFINSKAPDITGKDQNGKTVSLRDLRKKGPVVLVFYRGNWCPYCNKELKNLQDSLQLLTDLNATVIAISPEASEGVQETVKKTGANFSVLSDADAKWAKAYQVAYTVDERMVKRLQSSQIDLAKINNTKEAPVLPVPAVYIINRDGAVTYRYFNENYRERPSVRVLLENIR
ncbi:MAG: AhpC/TSA family protein [Chitinophagaceae bacterium]|nr:MAG: AhpC/TSA family protein [Chitinophagaceae bacterium]